MKRKMHFGSWKKLTLNLYEDMSMEETARKKTILIIEDDPDVLATVVKQLEYLGYDVLTASDGMEGMKKLDEGGYDLVITDIVMPFISGVGVVTALKEKMPNIPIIAMTGYGKEPEAAAMEKKADVVLAKPVKIAVLKDTLDKFLKP